jgi:hypothetical protein
MQPACNCLIVPFVVSFGHFIAVMLVSTPQKLRVVPKLGQSTTVGVPITFDANPKRKCFGTRQDAALAAHVGRKLGVLNDAGQRAASPDSPPLACKEASMARTNLKIYRGPAEQKAAVRAASKNEPSTVTVELNEVLPLLADAVASRRTWLNDFADDQITISADLYEVLLAYQYYRHPAA